MVRNQYRSWGINPQHKQKACVVTSELDAHDTCYKSAKSWLPYGCGSSYGDVCLNDHGVLLDSQKLDRFLSFDPTTGLLRCQSGVTLRAINQIFVNQGWFLPVTPGTQNVTVGGAIANDVHGKNHHQAGSFGCHVRRLGLYRSHEGHIECSQDDNQDLFQATIAGLGLTGFIQWAEFQLKAISSPYLQTEKMVFSGLQDFDALSGDADKKYEYTVAWIDSVAAKKNRGRGVYFGGNHTNTNSSIKPPSRRVVSIPFNAPTGLLNYSTVKLFNASYYYMHKLTAKKTQVYYEPFFYPLDSITHWNRLYGKKGLFQYQCVIPINGGIDVIQELLEICAHYAQGSFLSVLKKFGDINSPGMLSFPRQGYTLALDFRNLGKSTHEMFAELDKIVFSKNGALYPAKDARMTKEGFRQSFPNAENFMTHIDPMFSSDFLERAILGEAH